MVRDALNSQQQHDLLSELHQRLQRLTLEIEDRYVVGRQVSGTGEDVFSLSVAWLEALPAVISVARSPRVGR